MAAGNPQILRKPDGTSRGFGFVTYRDESMVEKCLVVQHTIGGKTVSRSVLCLLCAAKRTPLPPGVAAVCTLRSNVVC